MNFEKIKKGLFAFVLLSGCAGTPIMAADTTYDRIKTSSVSVEDIEKYKKVKALIEGLRDESRNNRRGKDFSLTVGLGIKKLTSGEQIAADFFVSTDTLLGLSYYIGQGDDLEKFKSISFNATTFVSNSFFINPALSYNESTSEYGNWDFINGNYSYAPVKTEDASLEFNIGNQWQWDNFTLGCKWIGINYTVYKMKNASRTPYDGARDIDINALNFYLGASF